MKVIFCVPSYDGKIDFEFMLSMEKTRELCHEHGIAIARTQFLPGDAYIHKARNTLVADFLESDATDMFFIDADMGWQPEAVLRMLALPYEFAAGVYPFKRDMEGYPAGLDLDADGKRIIDPSTGCISLLMAPTGFWRLRRSVFEKMLPFADLYHENGRQFRAFFKTPIIDGVWHGEDPAFCRYWIELGGKIWCEPDIDFKHIGRKTWTGNFGRFLAQMDEAKALAEIVRLATPEQLAGLDPTLVSRCKEYIAAAPPGHCRVAA